jgi:hypothetical protein
MRIVPIPPDAKDDPNSTEVVRGWVIDGRLQIALAAWVWRDNPETWGQFLAEAAGHVADAISKELGTDRQLVYAKIHSRLIEVLEDPPSNLVGDFVDRTQ